MKATSSRVVNDHRVQKTSDQIRKSNTTSVKDNNDYVSDILNDIPKFQKNNIKINLDTSTAVCRRCSMNLEFSYKEIENHIKDHQHNVQMMGTEPTPTKLKSNVRNKTNDTTGTLSTRPLKTQKKENTENMETKSSKETKQSGIENGIQKKLEKYDLHYSPIENNIHCQSCNMDIPSSVGKNIGHVNREMHQCRKPKNSMDNETVKNTNPKKCNFRRIQLVYFLKTAYKCKNALTEDVVVNDKYCIDVLSFHFLTPISPETIRCQVCKVNFPFKDTVSHVNVEKHNRAMKEVPVVIYADSEFIREIRSEIFQCGYCNIYETWDNIENHLNSSEHKRAKIIAHWCLRLHLPGIAQTRILRYFREHLLI